MKYDIKQVDTLTNDSLSNMKHQRNHSFWNYKFTNSTSDSPNKYRMLSFNNTIGHSCSNNNIKGVKLLKVIKSDKHEHSASFQMTNLSIPKFNDFKQSDNNNNNKKSCFAKLSNSPSIAKMSFDNSKTISNYKPIQTTPNALHPKKKIIMKQTNMFSNIQNKPIKYKIKPNDLYSLKQMHMNGPAIININNNINHNIQINVNDSSYNGGSTSSGSSNNIALFAPKKFIPVHHSTMNFKNIKIIGQKSTNSDVVFVENNEGNKKENDEKRNETRQMTITEEDICAVSRLNSIQSKKSNDMSKGFKAASSHSSINNQTISFDLSIDDNDNNNTIIRGFQQAKKINTINLFNKDDFKQFCIDMDKKLTLLK